MKFSRRDFLKLIGIVPATMTLPELKQEQIVQLVEPKVDMQKLTEEVLNTPIRTLSQPIMSGSFMAYSFPLNSASCMTGYSFPRSSTMTILEPRVRTRKEILQDNFNALGVKESKFDLWWREYGVKK
jgi:hypothetical protein